MDILFGAIALILGFFRPVWGFAIFLLGASGGLGFFAASGLLGAELGPLRPENLAVISATASLLLRRFRRAQAATPVDWIGVWLWLLTGLMFVSRVAELGLESLWDIAKFGLNCMFLAPLYLCFNELSGAERRILKQLVIFAAALTALLVVVTVITGNEMLYQTLIMDPNKKGSIVPTDFVTARITFPGLWTLVPLGFWLTVRELLDSKGLSFRTLLYGSGALLMLVAVLLNLGRSTALALASGLAVLVVLGFLMLKRSGTRRILIIMAICLAALVAGSGFQGLYAKWTDRFGEGTEASTWLQRVEKSKHMMSILIEEIPVLGHKDDHRDEAVSGDPYPFFRLWWDYGLLAAVSFFAAIIAIFSRLARNLRRHRWLPPETIKTTICLMAFFLDFQWHMLSGFYLMREAVFPLMFYFSEVVLVTQGLRLWQPQVAGSPVPGNAGLLPAPARQKFPCRRGSTTVGGRSPRVS